MIKLKDRCWLSKVIKNKVHELKFDEFPSEKCLNRKSRLKL